MSKLKLKRPPSKVVNSFKEYIEEYFLNEMDLDNDFYFDLIENILKMFFKEDEFDISLDINKNKVEVHGFYFNSIWNVDSYVKSFDDMIDYFIEGYSPDKKDFNCLIKSFKDAILKLETAMESFKE